MTLPSDDAEQQNYTCVVFGVDYGVLLGTDMQGLPIWAYKSADPPYAALVFPNPDTAFDVVKRLAAETTAPMPADLYIMPCTPDIEKGGYSFVGIYSAKAQGVPQWMTLLSPTFNALPV
jgi:hypothetical protein